MLSLITLAVLVLPIAYILHTYRCFACNLAAAKASNIPYMIVPVYMFQTWWLFTHQLFLPYLRRLPKSLIYPWLNVVVVDWSWDHLYATYAELGTDTFITVAPGGNVLWTADPSVISQITIRRNDFPKPIQMYGSIDIFGKNVVTTEGQTWRHHRKIASPPFSEKNNHMVWSESLHQAQAMLRSWTGSNGGNVRTVSKVAEDTMRLSLHVISRAGFGVRLLWPGIEDDDQQVQASKEAKVPGKDISSVGMGAGHTMTYVNALGTLLHSLLWVMLAPKMLLKYLPYKRTKVAYESYTEWGKYMNEMYQAKKIDVAAGKEDEGMDLMGALVKGAGVTGESMHASREKGQQVPRQALTDDEILGNAFVFILAGHETTANAIHFSLLYLALNCPSQRHLQIDLDQIFHGKPVSEWNYERDLPRLFGSMTGAVLNETLRLLPPVINIPKSTLKGQPQPININGKRCLAPPNMLINLVTVAVQRNPKYWPTGPPSDPGNPIHPTSNTDNDLEEFKPERWLLSEKSKDIDNHSHSNGSTILKDSATAETEDLGISTAADTSPQLFRPPKGAYIPFSEGYRACIGRRFAQVEVLAVLAVIFSQYSVELAVDEWASDEEVEKMGEDERAEVWQKAKRRARALLRHGMGSMITLQMRKGVVPLRFVKKGEERFGRI